MPPLDHNVRHHRLVGPFQSILRSLTPLLLQIKGRDATFYLIPYEILISYNSSLEMFD